MVMERCDNRSFSQKAASLRARPARVGFTLVELLIALAIVAIVAAVAIPGYGRYVAQSKQAEARRELVAIAQMEEIYRFQNGTYTSDLDDIRALGWSDGNCQFYNISIDAGATATTFTARAQGNIDGDATIDTWSIDQDGAFQHGTDDLTS